MANGPLSLGALSMRFIFLPLLLLNKNPIQHGSRFIAVGFKFGSSVFKHLTHLH
jgi:hypothetical protein